MRVELIQDAACWNAYVTNFPEASIYHRWAWGQLVEETFGHEAHYLAASSNGAIEGVLPFVSMKSRFFGQFLVSMPFSSYGGVLAATSEARNSLLEEAARFAQQCGARYVEMRQGIACDVQWLDKTPKVTMVVKLPDSVEELWARLSSGMRNKIRNARKQGLRIEWGRGEMVGTFYRIFSRNMRDLGTPVYPKRWFENLCRRLPGEVEIVTVWEGTQPVGAGLTISHGQTWNSPGRLRCANRARNIRPSSCTGRCKSGPCKKVIGEWTSDDRAREVGLTSSSGTGCVRKYLCTGITGCHQERLFQNCVWKILAIG